MLRHAISTRLQEAEDITPFALQVPTVRISGRLHARRDGRTAAGCFIESNRPVLGRNRRERTDYVGGLDELQRVADRCMGSCRVDAAAHAVCGEVQRTALLLWHVKGRGHGGSRQRV